MELTLAALHKANETLTATLAESLPIARPQPPLQPLPSPMACDLTADMRSADAERTDPALPTAASSRSHNDHTAAVCPAAGDKCTAPTLSNAASGPSHDGHFAATSTGPGSTRQLGDCAQEQAGCQQSGSPWMQTTKGKVAESCARSESHDSNLSLTQRTAEAAPAINTGPGSIQQPSDCVQEQAGCQQPWNSWLQATGVKATEGCARSESHSGNLSGTQRVAAVEGVDLTSASRTTHSWPEGPSAPSMHATKKSLGGTDRSQADVPTHLPALTSDLSYVCQSHAATKRMQPKKLPSATTSPPFASSCAPMSTHQMEAAVRISAPLNRCHTQHRRSEEPVVLKRFNALQQQGKAPASPPWAGNCAAHFPISTLQLLFSTENAEYSPQARCGGRVACSRSCSEYTLNDQLQHMGHETGVLNRPHAFKASKPSSPGSPARDSRGRPCDQLNKGAHFGSFHELGRQQQCPWANEHSSPYFHTRSASFHQVGVRDAEGRDCSSCHMSPSQRIRQRLHEGRYNLAGTSRHTAFQGSVAGRHNDYMPSASFVKSSNVPHWRHTHHGTIQPGQRCNFLYSPKEHSTMPAHTRREGCLKFGHSLSSPKAHAYNDGSQSSEQNAVHCQQLDVKVASLYKLLNP
jgi:hypothetical protein